MQHQPVEDHRTRHPVLPILAVVALVAVIAVVSNLSPPDTDPLVATPPPPSLALGTGDGVSLPPVRGSVTTSMPTTAAAVVPPVPSAPTGPDGMTTQAPSS